MSLQDERVRFYLRHAAQIEEWAGLRKEAAAAIDEWLKQLAPDLEQLASSLGSAVRLHAQVGDDTDWPCFRFLQAGWPEDSSQPGACVALEWARGKTILRDDYVPTVGVKCLKEDPVWSALRKGAKFEEERTRRKDQPSPHWAAWGPVSPKVEFLGAEDAYRTQLRSAVRDAWRAYAPLIEAALAGRTGTR